MNRRENGTAVMSTPRRAFGELKNIAYNTTPRPIDIKNLPRPVTKGMGKIFFDDAPVKKGPVVVAPVPAQAQIPIATAPLFDPIAPQFNRLRKVDSLDDLCETAVTKKGFDVYNDDGDAEIESFGACDETSFNMSNPDGSLILHSDSEPELKQNVTLSTISELSFNGMDDDEDAEIEVPFGGKPDHYEEEVHVPEDIILEDCPDSLPFMNYCHITNDEKEEHFSEDDLTENDLEMKLKSFVGNMIDFNDFSY